MKNILLFLLLIALSQLNAQSVCSGVIGDAKYSILDLSDFQAENGDCWVLVNGQSIIDSKLNTDYSISQLPDAQGRFIRVHDNRSSGRVDIDRNQGTPVGSVQDDEFKSHNHNSIYRGLMATNTTFFYGNNLTATGFDQSSGEANVKTQAANMPNAGGNETRPTNITLYLYMRIN